MQLKCCKTHSSAIFLCRIGVIIFLNSPCTEMKSVQNIMLTLLPRIETGMNKLKNNLQAQSQNKQASKFKELLHNVIKLHLPAQS